LSDHPKGGLAVVHAIRPSRPMCSWFISRHSLGRLHPHPQTCMPAPSICSVGSSVVATIPPCFGQAQYRLLCTPTWQVATQLAYVHRIFENSISSLVSFHLESLHCYIRAWSSADRLVMILCIHLKIFQLDPVVVDDLARPYIIAGVAAHSYWSA